MTFYRASDLLAGQWRAANRVDLTSLKEAQGEGVALGADNTVFLAGEGGGKGQPGSFARFACAPREMRIVASFLSVRPARTEGQVHTNHGGIRMKTRSVILVVGLLSTVALAGYMVVQLNGQASAPTGDYTNAAVPRCAMRAARIPDSGVSQGFIHVSRSIRQQARSSPGRSHRWGRAPALRSYRHQRMRCPLRTIRGSTVRAAATHKHHPPRARGVGGRAQAGRDRQLRCADTATADARGQLHVVRNDDDPSKTLPSHTSMLTGLPPERHGGLWNNVATADADSIDLPNIFSVARDHGYSTAAFFSKAKFQPLQRLGTLDYSQAPGGWFGRWSSDRTLSDVANYLQDARPNVLFVHLADVDAAGHWLGMDDPPRMAVPC